MVSMRRKVSLAVLLVLIIVLGMTFIRVVAPFLLPLFLAGMTAVVCQPLFRYFMGRTKDRISVAAGLTTATIMASILIPLITGTLLAILQLYTFASRVVDDSRWQMIFRRPEVVSQELEEAEEEADAVEAAEQLESDEDKASDQEPDESRPVTELPAEDSLAEKAPEEPAPPLVEPTEETEKKSPADQLVESVIQNVKEATTETEATEETETGLEKVKKLAQTHLKPEEPETFIEDAIIFVNSWLPQELRRDPGIASREIRLRIAEMMSEIGDRSLGRAAGTTFGILAGAAGTIIAALVGLMMYVVALYYFLADGTQLLQAAETLIPVHAKYQKQLLKQFALVVRSVVVATFLAAFAQGIATTLALWFFGFDHLFVLLALATVSALIPIAGTWMVWFPCAVILLASGHSIQAFLLTVYGAGFVGFLDNVVRTYVLNSDTKLHPLLAFISILGGLQVLGLWGVFIGPIVASCLHALIQIFNHELQELTKEKEREDAAPQKDKTEEPPQDKKTT